MTPTISTKRLKRIECGADASVMILMITFMVLIIFLISNITLCVTNRKREGIHVYQKPMPEYLSGYWREVHSGSLLHIRTHPLYEETWQIAKELHGDLERALLSRETKIFDRLWTSEFYIELVDGRVEKYQKAMFCRTEMEVERLRRSCWRDGKHVDELAGIYEKVEKNNQSDIVTV